MAPFKASLFLIVILLVSLLLANSALEPVAAEPAVEEHVFSHSWGAEGDQIRAPHGVAVAKDGTIYIANAGLDRITKISKATGASTFINWGESGSGDGQFLYMEGIAVDEDDNVYVVDGGEFEPDLGFHVIGPNRIQKFSSSGDYLTQWGSVGSGNGEFQGPTGIAVDKLGNVYVADSINNRIQKFSSSGVYVDHWGLSNPTGIAVDKDGYVYVAESYNNSIQKFSSSGAYVDHWGSNGSDDGQFLYPGGIAVDDDGNVYVADTEDYRWIADSNNNRIQKFSSSGDYLTQWGSEGSDPGQFHVPSGIAVTEAGNVYVADTRNDRIQKFNQKLDDSSGIYEIDYERQWGGSNGISDPAVIAVDADGNVYVVDAFKNRIQKFSSSGAYLAQWGSEGSGAGQFRSPGGIAVDGDGYVYVADSYNDRIQKFYSSGAYLAQWGSLGSGAGQFSSPGGIAVDKDGYVYVADSYNYRIQKFSSSGAYLTQWGSEGSGAGLFHRPGRIAIDRDGNVYVADSYNDRIQKFSSSGAFLDQWDGGCHNENGYVSFPDCGLAVDADGNLYVSDSNNSRIQKFNSSGAYLTQWGSEGSKLGQFKRPDGIAVDEDGNVFVADLDNHRIQVFTATHPDPDPTSGLVLNGSFENGPSLTPWAYSGNLSLPDALAEFELGAHDYGRYALRLDVSDPLNQDLDQASAHQTFYIPDTWSRPRLTFRYNMFVNDTIHFSDFFVAIQDGVGLSHKAEVLRAGYEPCQSGQDEPAAGQHGPPNPQVELGWRSAVYDLSAFKGDYIRLVFASRNLHPGLSKGISTYVDDVRVVDVGAEQVYLPVIVPVQSHPTCDPVPGSASNQQSNSVSLLQPAASDALQKRE